MALRICLRGPPAEREPRTIDAPQHHGAASGSQRLEPITAGPAEAALLDLQPGSPLMLVERTSWDAQGRAVEHARDLYRGDRSRFVTELTL